MWADAYSMGVTDYKPWQRNLGFMLGVGGSNNNQKYKAHGCIFALRAGEVIETSLC